MDHTVLRTTRASYERCCNVPQFFAAFYENFFRVCPEAKPKFAKTDFERQHRLLRHAFGLLLSFANDPAAEPNILRRVADRHSRRELDIHPSLYPLFVDALVTTVAEHDPEYEDEVGSAWRSAVADGVAYMQSRY